MLKVYTKYDYLPEVFRVIELPDVQVENKPIIMPFNYSLVYKEYYPTEIIYGLEGVRFIRYSDAKGGR